MPSYTDPTPPAFPLDVAVPAVIKPPRFEDFEGFRETTLCVFTDPEANTILRGLGRLLYDMALEYTAHWPHEPCGSFFHQVRAVLADLRHLQGWLAHLAGEVTASVLDFEEEAVAAVCGALAADLKAAGDALETRIPWAVDPAAPLPFAEVVRLCHPLPWKEQIAAAKAWILMKWMKGHGEGEGNSQLLRQIREHADRMDSFSFYHVLGLEMLFLLREGRSAKAFARFSGPALLKHFLSGADVPEEVREHYQGKKE